MKPIEAYGASGSAVTGQLQATQQEVGSPQHTQGKSLSTGAPAKKGPVRPSEAALIAGFVAQNTQGDFYRLDFAGG